MTASPRFEDRLFEQLREVVAARPEPAVLRSRRPRRTRLSVAAAGVAAATVAIVLVATGSDVTPGAYAVEPRPDGAVSVSIHSLRDAAGLQRSLRAAGLPAFVDYAAPGCAPPAGGGSLHQETRGKGETGPTLSRAGTPPAGGAKEVRRTKTVSSVRVDGSGAATFSLDPGTLKPGEHIYITTSSGSVSTIGIAIGKAKPAVGCGTP
jgi:hypothetical protein